MKGFAQVLLWGTLSVSGLSASSPFNTDDPNITEVIDSYAEKIPGIGLISNTISFDGIIIENFHFEDEKKYIFAKPGEKVPVYFNYTIDSSQLETLCVHHFIIGLHEDGPQMCVLHTLGIVDSEGVAAFSLDAPERPGAYQVRFCHSVDLTDEQAQRAWWRGEGTSAKTIAGILVVQ